MLRGQAGLAAQGGQQGCWEERPLCSEEKPGRPGWAERPQGAHVPVPGLAGSSASSAAVGPPSSSGWRGAGGARLTVFRLVQDVQNVRQLQRQLVGLLGHVRVHALDLGAV